MQEMICCRQVLYKKALPEESFGKWGERERGDNRFSKRLRPSRKYVIELTGT